MALNRRLNRHPESFLDHVILMVWCCLLDSRMGDNYGGDGDVENLLTTCD